MNKLTELLGGIALVSAFASIYISNELFQQTKHLVYHLTLQNHERVGDDSENSFPRYIKL